MADACGVVHVVCSEEAHHLLDGVVGLVHDAARRQEEGDARRTSRLDLRARNLKCALPADALESRLAAHAQHGIRESTERTEFR